jgi:pimeloyl-ACP methyl ester carboxylesterase
METWQIILLVILSYISINIIAFRIQERFLFRPEKLPQHFKYKYDFPFEELFFDIEPGVRINGLKFTSLQEGPPKGLIMYFHGNSRSIKGWGKYSTDFTQHGYDVVMIDYRGFGKSIGRRSEEALKKDAQFVYDQLKADYPESRILVYGRSIGSGFATKLASANHPRMLILDAPYYSMSRVAKRYLPFLPIPWILRYPIRTYTWIKYVKCPIKILHGTRDRLIPLQQSIDLQKLMPHQIELFAIKSGVHNNLPLFKQYHDALHKILTEAEHLSDDRFDIRPDLF